MCNALKSLMFVVFVVFGLSSPMLLATPLLDAPADRLTPPSISLSDSELLTLQNQLDNLKQQVSKAANYTQLEGSQNVVQALIQGLDRLTTALLPEQAQL